MNQYMFKKYIMDNFQAMYNSNANFHRCIDVLRHDGISIENCINLMAQLCQGIDDIGDKYLEELKRKPVKVVMTTPKADLIERI